LLRVLVGREKTIALYGPAGFIDQVHHKLQAYRWNLVNQFASDLIFVVTEIDSEFFSRAAQSCLKKSQRSTPKPLSLMIVLVPRLCN
jgi:ribonuclease Z